jgi:hypothetical protein
VCPRAGLDAVVRRKIPSPYWDLNPRIIQPVAQHCNTELSRLLFSKCILRKFQLLCLVYFFRLTHLVPNTCMRYSERRAVHEPVVDKAGEEQRKVLFSLHFKHIFRIGKRSKRTLLSLMRCLFNDSLKRHSNVSLIIPTLRYRHCPFSYI